MTDQAILSNRITPRIARVRHDLKFRTVTVERVVHVTPHMIRVTFRGADLAGFTSASHDDHVKLFFPKDGTATPTVPTRGPDGRLLVDEADRPIARDYTPRRYDPVLGELDIDFALHEAGPATHWALQAAPGQQLGIGGPRGSFVVANDFDWYLFVGDETALPAIGRRLDELPLGASVIVIAEVVDAAEEQVLSTSGATSVTWLHRGAADAGTTALLEDAVRSLRLPRGDGFVWVACESEAAKRIRHVLVQTHNHPKDGMRVAGYWRRGDANVHESHND